MKAAHLLAAAIALAAFSAAHAQEGAVTIRVDSGSVMTSQGGEFVTASSGAQLTAGNRVMLAENSRATLVYGNGCTQSLTAAGVYSVPATCVAAAGSSTAAVDVQGAAIISGIAALTAAGLASMGDGDTPLPVSR